MKLRSKKDGTIINVPSELENQVRAIIEAGGDPTELLQDNQMAKGGMIKRADGSYSQRGLWDNIRAKAAANKKAGKKGKKPTKAMLEQEAEIRAAEKAYGGYMADGGINNPGFRALPDYVQEKIKANMNYGGYMASGGCMECGGMMESGGKMPQWLAEARFPDKSKLEEYGYKPVDQAGDGKWIQKATASIKRRGTEGVCTGSKFGGPSCPPGSKRYNLAKTFRKMAKSRKDDGGYNLPIAQNSIDPTLIGQNDNFDFSQQGLVRANPFVSNVPLQQPSSIFAPKPAMSDREKELRSVAGIYSPEGQEEFDFSRQGLVKPNPFVSNVILPKPYEPISEARQKQVRDMAVLDPSQLKKFEDSYFPNNLNDNLPYRPGAFQSDDNVPYTYSGSQSDEIPYTYPQTDEVPFMRTRTGTESPDNTPAPNELVQSARRMGKKERRKFFADYNEGLRNEKQPSAAPTTTPPKSRRFPGLKNFNFDFSQLGNFNPLSMLMGSLSGINFGNPYYNRMFRPAYNPYVQYGYNQYYKNGGRLPIAQIGKFQDLLQDEADISEPDIVEPDTSTFDDRVLQVIDSDMLPKEPTDAEAKEVRDSISENKFSNSFNSLKGIAGLTNIIPNAIKGNLFNKGIEKTNRKIAEMQSKNQQIGMSETNPPPTYETQGYGFSGRNALAADGMQIRQIGGMGEPNVEVEGREHIKLPNGFSQEIQGKSHAQGGIPLNLPQGTQIFSEKLKVEISFLKELAELNPDYQFLKSISLPKSGKISYADLAKKFETKKYVDLLNSKSADSIQMATAQMMIAQNTAKLEKIFMLQEQNKISGVHGPMVQQKAMEERQESEAQEQAEQQQEPEEPMMAHGGYHLPSYQNAGQTGIDYSNWKGQTFKTTSGIVTPQGVNLNVDPLADWARFAKRYGPLDERITQQQTPEAIAALQENIYDDYLDTEHGREALSKMWQEFGVTNQMEEKYGDIAKKIKNKEKLSLDDLNRLRGNYIDSLAGKRLPEYLEPRIYTPNIKGPTSSAPEETTPPTPEQMQAKQDQFPGISLNVAANLPMAISRDALNFYKLTPQYIDPRYLDIQPQLNRVARSQRALMSNIGSRGSADMANLLQAQANADIAAGEAFGQKYNYDRAQDAAAQQFNAQAKTDIDKYNQQAWFQQLEDPIRRREGAIDTWQRAKAEQQDEYRQKMAQYYNNLDFMQRTLPYFQNMDAKQAYQYANLMGTAANPFLGEQATTKKKRNGGKVKIKPKFKK